MLLAASPGQIFAQETTDHSSHPLTSMWLVMANPALPENPSFPAPAWFSASGNVVLAFPPSDIGPNGVVLQSSPVGIWESYDDRTEHFTVVQTLSAPAVPSSAV